jgi:hypothetical protein
MMNLKQDSLIDYDKKGLEQRLRVRMRVKDEDEEEEEQQEIES